MIYQFPNGTKKYLEMKRINDSYFKISNFVNVENRVYKLMMTFLDEQNKIINITYFNGKDFNVSY